MGPGNFLGKCLRKVTDKYSNGPAITIVGQILMHSSSDVTTVTK